MLGGGALKEEDFLAGEETLRANGDFKNENLFTSDGNTVLLLTDLLLIFLLCKQKSEVDMRSLEN